MHLIKDYIIIDDFFENPKEVVRFAKDCYYYESIVKDTIYFVEMPDLNVCPQDANYPIGKWRGYRTPNLKLVHNEFYEYFSSKLKRTIFNCHTINYDMVSFFQISTKNINYLSDKWWHKDKCALAGVIYLAENPPPNSGTLLKDKNGEIITLENKFNRFILYDSAIYHRIESCFGSSLNDCRLTLVFFVDDINIKSEYSTA